MGYLLVKLRVVLVEDNGRRAAPLDAALQALGHEVVARLASASGLLAVVRRLQPDLIVAEVVLPRHDLLESCAAITRECPRPIVVLAQDSNTEAITRALRAGVASYVVDAQASQRLQPILDVAIARFQETQAVRDELEATRTRLADRRDVERAKVLLMQRRQLAEEQAYVLLRSAAMARRTSIGDAARSVLSAAELLSDG